MNNQCAKCGRMESEIAGDARRLGLLSELQQGLYTCCQISEWADEQLSAWLEAMYQDAQLFDEIGGPNECAYVYVRLRRTQR